MKPLLAIAGLLAACSPSAGAEERGDDPGERAIVRAIQFLSIEVPKWRVDNHCYSCHNNGDAARALYRARQASFDVPPEALADTAAWLGRPDDWKHNGPDSEFNDRQLAAIQFASALSDAQECGETPPAAAHHKAAELLLTSQLPDGSWQIDPGDSLGAPATYGRTLATAVSWRVLRTSGDERFQPAATRAGKWLRTSEPKTVMESAAVLRALAAETDNLAIDRRQQCLDVVTRGEQKSGGWGPYLRSAPEPFDTALVLLALSKLPADEHCNGMISRGREWLIAAQFDDGSWPETTRPAGRESYAQRISTTGWALLALLATRGRPPGGQTPVGSSVTDPPAIPAG